jgi:hypothetical protein
MPLINLPLVNLHLKAPERNLKSVPSCRARPMPTRGNPPLHQSRESASQTGQAQAERSSAPTLHQAMAPGPSTRLTKKEENAAEALASSMERAFRGRMVYSSPIGGGGSMPLHYVRDNISLAAVWAAFPSVTFATKKSGVDTGQPDRAHVDGRAGPCATAGSCPSPCRPTSPFATPARASSPSLAAPSSGSRPVRPGPGPARPTPIVPPGPTTETSQPERP